MAKTNIEQIADNIVETIKKKNAAYGNAFEDDLNEYGLMAASIQMGHKIKRFKTLAKDASISDNGESIADSITDLIGYGLLTLDWLSQNSNKIRFNE